MTDDPHLPDGWKRVTETIDPDKVVQHRRIVAYRDGEPWVYEADFRTTPPPITTPAPIVHVPQRYKTDCGVAVVAMLAQVTWAEAEEAMFPLLPDGTPRGPNKIRTFFSSTEIDVRRGLEHFGLEVMAAPQGGFSPADETWWDVLSCVGKDFGLLREQFRQDGNWHWAILEGSTGMVWDPAAPDKRPEAWGMRPAPHSFWVVVRPTPVLDLSSRRLPK